MRERPRALPAVTRPLPQRVPSQRALHSGARAGRRAVPRRRHGSRVEHVNRKVRRVNLCLGGAVHQRTDRPDGRAQLCEAAAEGEPLTLDPLCHGAVRRGRAPWACDPRPRTQGRLSSRAACHLVFLGRSVTSHDAPWKWENGPSPCRAWHTARERHVDVELCVPSLPPPDWCPIRDGRGRKSPETGRPAPGKREGRRLW